MTLVEGISLAVMLTAVFVGLSAAAFLVGQRPSFWIGAVVFAFKQAWPHIKSYILARNTPEIEEKMAECVRRGGEWDNLRKRCRDK